jgi:hypothetical protein
MYSNLLIAINLLVIPAHPGEKEPDIALGYPELQAMPFLVRECGYSDPFNITKRRMRTG